MILQQNLDHFKTLNDLQEGLAILKQQKAAMEADQAQQAKQAAELARQEAAAAELETLRAETAQKEAQWAGIVARYEAAIDTIADCTAAMKELNGWQSRNGSRLTDAGIGVKMASTPKIQQVAKYRLWG